MMLRIGSAWAQPLGSVHVLERRGTDPDAGSWSIDQLFVPPRSTHQHTGLRSPDERRQDQEDIRAELDAPHSPMDLDLSLSLSLR